MGGLTHDEVMEKICGVCYRKQKGLRKITEATLELIKDHHFAQYSLFSGDFPLVVCASCQSILGDRKSDNPKNNSPRKLPPPKYEAIRGTRASRSSDKCPCGWCEIWRMNGYKYREYKAGVRDPTGRHVITPPPPPPASREKCDGCHGEIKQGIKHVCNLRTLETNLLNEANALPQNQKERLLSSLIDNVKAGKDIKGDGTMHILTRNSRYKTITIGKIKPEKTFTRDDIIKLKRLLDLSCNQTKKLAGGMRTVLGKRGVEPNLMPYLTEINHRLDGFFKLEQFTIVKTVKGVETELQRSGVFCKDVKGLVKLMMEVNEIDPANERILIGFDDGGGKYKIFSYFLIFNHLKDKTLIYFAREKLF